MHMRDLVAGRQCKWHLPNSQTWPLSSQVQGGLPDVRPWSRKGVALGFGRGRQSRLNPCEYCRREVPDSGCEVLPWRRQHDNLTTGTSQGLSMAGSGPGEASQVSQICAKRRFGRLVRLRPAMNLPWRCWVLRLSGVLTASQQNLTNGIRNFTTPTWAPHTM
jgi:hypothetical protein